VGIRDSSFSVNVKWTGPNWGGGRPTGPTPLAEGLNYYHRLRHLEESDRAWKKIKLLDEIVCTIQ